MKQRQQFVGANSLVGRTRNLDRRLQSLERAGTTLVNTLTIIEVDDYKHQVTPAHPKGFSPLPRLP